MVIDAEVWIGYLRQLSRAVVEEKDKSLLFNSAVFDPPEGSRIPTQRLSPCRLFMVLDFDNGMVSPEIFDKAFWSEAKRGTKASFVMCNSFSRSAEKPNKFRAILFYRRPAMSLEEHEAVFDWVAQRLSEAGFQRCFRFGSELPKRGSVVLLTLYENGNIRIGAFSGNEAPKTGS